MDNRKTWLKISAWATKAFESLKSNAKRGIKWAGPDGLLNMETTALLVIALGIFLPTPWAAAVSFLISVFKCASDERRGHSGEIHDLVCATAGVVVGTILLLAL